MRYKEIIKFIFILIMILLIYLGIILNIDYLTISYNEKVESYTNPYDRSNNTPDTLAELEILDVYYEVITPECIQVIKNSEIIKNILKECNNIEEDHISKYIEFLKGENRIKLVKENIIYIKEENYALAFSMDMNNIVYESGRIYANNRFWSSKEITVDNKTSMYAKVTRDMEKIGITEKFGFDPETIYIKYYNGIIADWDNDIYIIEDHKNHIKLEYEMPTYIMKKLQIGFEYSLSD